MTSLDLSRFPGLSSKRSQHDRDTDKAFEAIPEASASQHHAPLKLPAIPDLRFEYSYLKSVSSAVKTSWVEDAGSEGGGHYEVVSVNWKRVGWITTRDQIITPLLQGTVWCVPSKFGLEK